MKFRLRRQFVFVGGLLPRRRGEAGGRGVPARRDVRHERLKITISTPPSLADGQAAATDGTAAQPARNVTFNRAVLAQMRNIILATASIMVLTVVRRDQFGNNNNHERQRICCRTSAVDVCAYDPRVARSDLRGVAVRTHKKKASRGYETLRYGVFDCWSSINQTGSASRTTDSVPTDCPSSTATGAATSTRCRAVAVCVA